MSEPAASSRTVVGRRLRNRTCPDRSLEAAGNSQVGKEIAFGRMERWSTWLRAAGDEFAAGVDWDPSVGAALRTQGLFRIVSATIMGASRGSASPRGGCPVPRSSGMASFGRADRVRPVKEGPNSARSWNVRYPAVSAMAGYGALRPGRTGREGRKTAHAGDLASPRARALNLRSRFQSCF
jgi:hypothetical protein